MVLRAPEEEGAVGHLVAELEADAFHEEALARLNVSGANDNVPKPAGSRRGHRALLRQFVRSAPAVDAAGAVIDRRRHGVLLDSRRDLDSNANAGARVG